MVLDIILIILFIFMLIYGYFKGCIGIVAKLVSLILASVLAYLLADTVGDYIAGTQFGIDIKNSIQNTVIEKINNVEENTAVSIIINNVGNENQIAVTNKITDYIFVGVGFVTVYIFARLVLWIAQMILESVFELPILKMFNKLGGVMVAGLLFIVELSVVLAIIKSISTISFMNNIVTVINSSIITKVIYDHNIITNIILSKII